MGPIRPQWLGLALNTHEPALEPRRQQEFIALLLGVAVAVPLRNGVQKLPRGVAQAVHALRASLPLEDPEAADSSAVQGVLAAAACFAVARHAASAPRGESSDGVRRTRGSESPISPALQQISNTYSGRLRNKDTTGGGDNTVARCAVDAAKLFGSPEAEKAPRGPEQLGRFGAICGKAAPEIDQRMRATLEPSILQRLVAAAARGNLGCLAFLEALLSGGDAPEVLTAMHIAGNERTQQHFEVMFERRDPLLGWLCEAEHSIRAAAGALMYPSGDVPQSALVEVIRSGSAEARRALAALACGTTGGGGDGEDGGTGNGPEIPRALRAMVSERDNDHEFEEALKTLCLQNSLQQRSQDASVLLRALVQNAGEHALELLAKHIENENEVVWWQLAKLAALPPARAKLRLMPQCTYRKLAVAARALQLLHGDTACDDPEPDPAAAARSVSALRCSRRKTWRQVSESGSESETDTVPQPRGDRRGSRGARRCSGPVERYMLRMRAARAERNAAVPALDRDRRQQDAELMRDGLRGWRLRSQHRSHGGWRGSRSGTPTPEPRGLTEHLARMEAAVETREQAIWRRKLAERARAEQLQRQRQEEVTLAAWAQRDAAHRAARRATKARHQMLQTQSEQLAREAREWDEQYERAVAAQAELDAAASSARVHRARGRLLDRLGHVTVSAVVEPGAPQQLHSSSSASQLGRAEVVFHHLPTTSRRAQVVGSPTVSSPRLAAPAASPLSQSSGDGLESAWTGASDLTHARCPRTEHPDHPGRGAAAAEMHVERLRGAASAEQTQNATRDRITGAFAMTTARRCRTAPGELSMTPAELQMVTHRLYRKRRCYDPDALDSSGYVIGDWLSRRYYPREAPDVMFDWEIELHTERLARPHQRKEVDSGLPRVVPARLADEEVDALAERLSPSREEQMRRRHLRSREGRKRRRVFQQGQKRLTQDQQDELAERIQAPLQSFYAARHGTGQLYYVDNRLYDRGTGKVVSLATSRSGGSCSTGGNRRLPSIFQSSTSSLSREKVQASKQLADKTRVMWNQLAAGGPLPRETPWWTYLEADAAWSGTPPPEDMPVPAFYWNAPNIAVRIEDRPMLAKPLSAVNNNKEILWAVIAYFRRIRGLEGILSPVAWVGRDTQFYLLVQQAPSSLCAWLRANRVQGVPLRLLLQIAQQLADGLGNLHDCGSVHRNVALRSCMVMREPPTGAPTVAIGDPAGPLLFDTAWHAQSGADGASEQAACALTPALWWPPEVVEALQGNLRRDRFIYTQSTVFAEPQDVYGLGVLLWELFALGLWLPFTSPVKPLPLETRLVRLQYSARLPMPPGCPEPLWDYILAPCLARDAAARPSARQVAECIAGTLSSNGASVPDGNVSVDDTVVTAPQEAPVFWA